MRPKTLAALLALALSVPLAAGAQQPQATTPPAAAPAAAPPAAPVRAGAALTKSEHRAPKKPRDDQSLDELIDSVIGSLPGK